MQTLIQLYLQNPFWIWMAVGAIFVAFDIAVGLGRLIWPAVAAAVLAFVNLAGERIGVELELGLFIAVSMVGIAVSIGVNKRQPHASVDEEMMPRRSAAPPEEGILATPDRTGRLIGRIGRTTGEFINGVGRVWIDGTEWGAEIDGVDELPPDVPVRVMGVSGGVRLRVQGLG